MFTDKDGTSAGTSISINAGGYPEVGGNIIVIWLQQQIEYKFILKTAGGLEEWTADNIRGLVLNATVVDDYDGVIPILLDGTATVGTLITVRSPSGFVYEKKQGIATDNDLSIITENRGTTAANQYYAELTGAAAELPNYASNGDAYEDFGISGTDQYVLMRRENQLPMREEDLKEWTQFRFRATRNYSFSSTPTVDISDALGQPQGTTIKEIYMRGERDLQPGQIPTGLPVTLTYYEESDYFILVNDSHSITYDGESVHDALDDLYDQVGDLSTLPADSVDTDQIVAAAVGQNELATSVGSASGSVIETGEADATLASHSLFPMISSASGVLLKGASTASDADNPRLGFYGQSPGSYSVQYRYIITA